MERTFVGRADVYNKLHLWLSQEQEDKLRVISVEGSGGIGKTTLIEEVLRALDMKDKRYLTLRLRGEDFLGQDGNLDPVTVLADLANRVRDQLPKDNEPYFGLTANLKKANDELNTAIRKKVGAKLDVEIAEAGKDAIRLLIQSGRALGEVFPKIKDYVDLDKVDDKTLQQIEQYIDDARKSYELGGNIVDAMKGLWKHAKNQNRLVKDAWRAMSEDFYRDLVAILSGWKSEGEKPLKLLAKKVPGMDHLFFFIDDYECIQNDFGKHFLVRNLLPKLSTAPFKTTLLICGRDVLSVADPGFKLVAIGLKKHTIRLKPLKMEDVLEILQANKLPGDLDALARKIFSDTEGYPLLVDLAIDEQGQEGVPVVALKKFYDRQTYWMNHLQKKWLDRLAFLDEVNLETIPKVLPNEDAEVVFDWFEREGSIRDTKSSKWTVRPYVRTRVVEYFKSKRPTEYQRLMEAAAK